MEFKLEGKPISKTKTKDEIIKYLNTLKDGELITTQTLTTYTGVSRTDGIRNVLGKDADKYIARYKNRNVYGNQKTIKALIQ